MNNEFTYGEILSKGKYNINKKCLFGILKEEEEILLTRELTNFILWANENIEMISLFLKKENIEVFSNDSINKTILVEFWLKYIGKCASIETLIDNVEIISDVYEYVITYYDKISIFKIPYDYKMVSYSKYRTEEQYIKLKNLIENSNYYRTQIYSIFSQFKCDLDHIDSKMAERILCKFTRG